MIRFVKIRPESGRNRHRWGIYEKIKRVLPSYLKDERAPYSIRL
jgi:hypothetical protein